MYTIVLLGDIAAGKGTQAKILAKKHKLYLVETGAFTRKYWTGSSKIGQRLAKAKLGKLAPTNIIRRYLKKTLTKTPANRSLLLDGGKMPTEARLINSIFQKQKRKFLVIYLRIPKQEIFNRLAFRYYCEKTGQPVVIKDGSWKCPHCRGPVIKRADDDALAVKNRINYYDKIYSKTVEFWKKQKLIKFVNGNQPIPAVTKDIERIIKHFYGAN